MHDRKKPRGTPSDRTFGPKADDVAAVPLCRYEELAQRENRLRQAASRQDKK